ncbi:MAG: SGNH/GDSL hydrolase family protein [Pedobacter sp.]|nr:SGNH/GDSL hydrolase family protein [Pedobacter sp.]
MLKAQEMKVKITNAGYNGNNTEDLLKRLDKDVFAKDPQLVIMMIGTNDMLNERNRLSFAQYEKNYQELITLIKKKSKLMIMTIPPVNDEYIFARQDRKAYGESRPQSWVDSANRIIKKLAKKNKVKLIDLHQVLTACGGAGVDQESLFQNMANSGITDGVHPTKIGYRVIGTAVFQAIQYNMPGVESIVCFGDSITFGYQMTGMGTVKGDSYPAVLNRMMNDSYEK